MHTCNNRRCVNPAHLQLGTESKNRLGVKRPPVKLMLISLEQRQAGGVPSGSGNVIRDGAVFRATVKFRSGRQIRLQARSLRQAHDRIEHVKERCIEAGFVTTCQAPPITQAYQWIVEAIQKEMNES